MRVSSGFLLVCLFRADGQALSSWRKSPLHQRLTVLSGPFSTPLSTGSGDKPRRLQTSGQPAAVSEVAELRAMIQAQREQIAELQRQLAVHRNGPAGDRP